MQLPGPVRTAAGKMVLATSEQVPGYPYWNVDTVTFKETYFIEGIWNNGILE